MKPKKLISVILSTMLMLSLISATALLQVSADTAHSHCICGGNVNAGDHTSHTNQTFSPWDGDSEIPYNSNIAYLYLTEDTVRENGILTIASGKTLYLCLNGHSLQNSSRGDNVIDVDGGQLILCDCQGNGWIGGRTSGANSGSVWVSGASACFTMYGGNLSHNTGVARGGGLYIRDNAAAKIYGGSISNNSVLAYGGGVYIENKGSSGNTSLTMYGGTIENNSADRHGGGVALQSDTTFNLLGGAVQNNRCANDGGGISATGNIVIENAVVKNNSAGSNGGGIYHNYGSLTITNGVIEGNTAAGNGGGIYTENRSTALINSCSIKNNTCEFTGGGICMGGEGSNSTLTLKGASIENNTAKTHGGGIYYYEYNTVTLDGLSSIIIQNNTSSNIYMTSNNLNSKKSKYNIDIKNLVQGSHIGVSTQKKPIAGTAQTFSTVSNTDYSQYFFSDSECYLVRYNSEKALELTADIKSFKLNYNANGGICDITEAKQQKLDGNEATFKLSPAPTRQCYTFLGWADSADATAAKYTANSDITVTGEKTVYAIWRLSHTLSHVEAVSPTCTTDGSRAYYACSECEKNFEDQAATKEIADISTYVIPHGHTLGEWIDETAATKEAAGTVGHRDCTVCGKHFDINGNEITELSIKFAENTVDEGLSGGAVAGITVGSVVVVEAGAFSMFWFVIKKKRIADLAAIFKK